ncbi:MAG: hypothetical protein ACRDGS_15525 [Chloroflexota bacterium]
MRRRFPFAAFFVLHSRTYLAAHWTVTGALAVILLSASQPTPVLGLKTQPGPLVPASCPSGQVQVHFYATGATECLVIVGAGF